MRKYVCDNNNCKRRYEKYDSVGFYEIVFNTLKGDAKDFSFDLCEDCYDEFRRKNKGYWL